MRLNTFFSIIGLAIFLSLDLSAQTVRVIFVSGRAELQRPDETAAHAAQKGESVIIGTRISTGSDGRVVLTPMPGVKSMIAPNSIVVLESASDSHPSATEVKHQATLDLQVGAVVSDLQKQPGATFDYSIRTPRGLAGARGTTFTVGLNAAGIQTIVVSHGTINLSLADGRTVSLTIGQISVTQPGGETEHSGKASELSTADQKLAANWVKTTLETLSDAVESGIQLQPDALSNALSTAQSLGIPIPPELQQRVDTLISNPPATTTDSSSTTDSTTTTTPSSTTSNTTTTDILASTAITPPPNLTPDQLLVFQNLSPAAQQAIVNLNDPDITIVALTPDPDTGLPLTDSDIVRHLTALSSLKSSDPASYALFKTLAGATTITTASIPRGASGGAALPYIDSAPDPTQWSADAFARALAMWNSTASDCLSSLQKQQLVSLGAGEAVMDRSASYLSALLDSFGSLSPTDQGNLQNAGWGRYLAEIANNPTNLGLTSALGTIGGYDSAQISLLKDLGISPKELLDTENNGYSVGELLTALNDTSLISSTDFTTLRQLGIRNNLLSAYAYFDSTGTDFVGFLSNSIAFYNSLTADQQKAVRALGAGNILLFHSPDDFIGYGPNETPIYISDRITELAQFYIDNPSDQQALRDMGLFEDKGMNNGSQLNGSQLSDIFISDISLDTTFLQNAITAYKGLAPRTRDYLASEGQNYSFLQLYIAGLPASGNTLVSTDSPPSSLRTFTEISALLGKLTSAEYSALLDIDGARAIFERYHLGDCGLDTDATVALANIKTFLDFYVSDLGASQKSTLRELGIVGDGSVAFLGADPADHTGLGRLLTAYAGLPGGVRASTERLDENFASYGHFGNSTDIKDRSYFFPYGETQVTMTNVSFEAAGNLYVGATKYLVIDGTTDSNVTFTVANGKDLALRASNLIDLTSTTFSAGVRTITMEAATINLTNINFPGGAGVYLNSKLGGTADGATGAGMYPHFGSSAYGRVNFIGGVSYGGNLIDSTAAFDSYGDKIHIGTLASPVIPPPPGPLL